MIPIEDNPVELFWPVSHRPTALGVMHPGDPAWNWGLLAAGVGVQAFVLLKLARDPDRAPAVRSDRSGDSNRSR